MKKGFKENIERLALKNKTFRTVVYTAKDCQLVLMSLLPREEIGMETHKEGDQFFRFESGAGRVIIDKTTYTVKAGDGVIVPMGAKHNIINTSRTKPLKLYTIYAPPHHKDGTVHNTRAEAIASTEKFDGNTTEK